MSEMKQFLSDNTKNFRDVQIIEFAPPGKWAHSIAQKLDKEMKITQLRKIFTTIKSLEMKVKGKNQNEIFSEQEFYMLIPHLAYAKGRKLIPADFYDLMKAIIGDGKYGKIKTVEDFRRFVDFMTAIIAYHKEMSTAKGGNKHD